MTQPPIVPGPPEPEQTPPPQVIYVQASSPTHEGQNANAVTKGILNAFGWVIVGVLAVCVGIPAVLCLIGLLGGGLSLSK